MYDSVIPIRNNPSLIDPDDLTKLRQSFLLRTVIGVNLACVTNKQCSLYPIDFSILNKPINNLGHFQALLHSAKLSGKGI